PSRRRPAAPSPFRKPTLRQASGRRWPSHRAGWSSDDSSNLSPVITARSGLPAPAVSWRRGVVCAGGGILMRRIGHALAELGAAPPLGAVCLLVANDHQFKRLFHNAFTGKLSDIAICFLLPLLVSAALGLVSDWPGRRRLVLGAVVTVVVFTLLE